MNFKAMNMKKGLKRFWIIGSVFWFVCHWIPPQFEVFGFDLDETIYRIFVYWIVSQIIWWALLYVGFWVARGFVDDDDKKAGF